jgi:two-component system NtrC family sensor kinase
LIVDDEKNVIKSLRRLLLNTDYNLLTAESGKEGMEALDNNDVQVVISDYRMPGVSGVEFLSRVKEKYPDTIRMILSGYADVSAIVEAINEGHVYKFISKPWNDQEILTTIIRSFEQYQLQMDNAELMIEIQNRNSELEKLTESLEEKVTERTRDLEMKNRALTVAQNILNLLPMGVLGIDSDFTIVYMNDYLKYFLNTEELNLGRNFSAFADKTLKDQTTDTLTNQKVTRSIIDREENVNLICTPLPDRAGVICTFYYNRDSKNNPVPNEIVYAKGEPIVR